MQNEEANPFPERKKEIVNLIDEERKKIGRVKKEFEKPIINNTFEPSKPQPAMKRKLLYLFILTIALINIDSYRARAQDSIVMIADTPIVDSAKAVVIPSHDADTTIVQGDKVIHIGEGNTPPLFYKELPKETGGTIGTFIWSLIGLFLVYILGWQEKKGRDGVSAETFNFVVWLKHNILFFLMYVAAFALLYWNVGSMHPLAAIAIGFAAPKMIEQIRKRFGSTT